MKQWLKSFVHNAIVHPILPFVPGRIGARLHDINADWAFGKVNIGRVDELKIEDSMVNGTFNTVGKALIDEAFKE